MRTVIGAVAGAAAAYFFDPDSGNGRRAMARDRVMAFFRDTAGAAESTATRAAHTATGMAAEARSAATGDEPAPNDQALADRVQSTIFRGVDVPPGEVNVNAEEGIVYLRGEVAPETAKELVAAARGVEGVRAVENMLHAPGEPAPHKQETEEETRRRVSG